MAQPATSDPRSELLAASRTRSGSKMDDPEVPAPGVKEPISSTFNNLRGKFDARGGGGGGGVFGSSVSKMKERFQAGQGAGGRSQEHDVNSSNNNHLVGGKLSDRSSSPDSKIRKKVSTAEAPIAAALDPRRRSSSNVETITAVLKSPPISPSHATKSRAFFASSNSVNSSSNNSTSGSSVAAAPRRRKSQESQGSQGLKPLNVCVDHPVR